MCHNSRRQCVRSIVSSFVQSGGDPPVNVDFFLCPLIHTKLTCRVAFSLTSVTNLSHRSASPSLFNWAFSLQETSSNTHDVITIRSDLQVSVLYSHRRACPSAMPVITNTEEDSTSRPSESRILIADACPINQRHYPFIAPGFTVATPSDHDCLVLVFHDEEFPTAGTARACVLHLQVLHHKKDTSVIRLCDRQPNCLFFCVQTQPQRSSRRLFFCSGSSLLLFSALAVVNLSTPAVDSEPLMSRRLVPAFFHSASRRPCLIS